MTYMIENFPATDEQTAILDAAINTDDNLIISAFAGAGKTSTLVGIADVLSNKNIVYMAYNKAIQMDSLGRFPFNVKSKTIHGIAYGGMVSEIKARPQLRNLYVNEISKFLKGKLDNVSGYNLSKMFMLAGRDARQSLIKFCQSDKDTVIDNGGHLTMGKSYYHNKLDEILYDQKNYSSMNDENALELKFELMRKYRKVVAQAAQDAWDAIMENKSYPLSHDIYLKLFQLEKRQITNGTMPLDILMVDEAQDLNPVMIQIIRNQDRARLIICGDSKQQLYAWRNAVDAMDKFPGENFALTTSFRFGNHIANLANIVLKSLGEEKEIVGKGQEFDSELIPEMGVTHICRTNLGCLNTLMALSGQGYSFHIVGGIKEIKSNLQAILALNDGETPNHWQIKQYDKIEDLYDDRMFFSTMSSLITQVYKNPEESRVFLDVLNDVCDGGEDADIVITTAHKSKGREWDQVVLNEDFVKPRLDEPYSFFNLPPDERNLLYVAITRGKNHISYPEELLGGLDQELLIEQ